MAPDPVNIRALLAFPQDRRAPRTPTGAAGGPNTGRGIDLAIVRMHDHLRLAQALVAAPTAVPRSAAKSPGTFVVDGDLGHLEGDVAAVV
jgi:hypothetical protein